MTKEERRRDLRRKGICGMALAGAILGAVAVHTVAKPISTEYIICDIDGCYAVGDETLVMVELPNGEHQLYPYPIETGNPSLATIHLTGKTAKDWEVVAVK